LLLLGCHRFGLKESCFEFVSRERRKCTLGEKRKCTFSETT
jgi:hypothetical protein